MVKYRRLTLEELEELREQFVQFVSVQGYSGPDWEQLKVEQPQKVQEIIGQFSDMVWEDVLGRVTLLELKRAHDLRLYYFDEEVIRLRGLVVEGEAYDFDFRQPASPQEMMQRIRKHGAQLKFFHAERPYRKDRRREVFELMEKGALISRDEQLYRQLDQWAHPSAPPVT